MKTYVVNLDKSTERLARITRQLNESGMQFERIPAVYGASLSKQELRRDFARFRSMLAMKRKLLVGEIGCSLSHDKVYRRMISDGIDIALVLEDDVIVSPNIKATLSGIQEFVDKQQPQVFILSCYDKSRYQESAIAPIHDATCTDGYVITLPAAKAILKANYPVITTADPWPRWERKLGLQVYQCMPKSVYQLCLDEYRSEIQGDKTSKKMIGMGIRSIAHKVKSLFSHSKS